MNAWANLTAIAAFASCIFFALRLHALKVEKAGEKAAPLGSRIWMLVMAGSSLFHSQAALMLQQSSWTEFFAAACLMGYAFHMWLNVRTKVVVPIRQGLVARS